MPNRKRPAWLLAGLLALVSPGFAQDDLFGTPEFGDGAGPPPLAEPAGTSQTPSTRPAGPPPPIPADVPVARRVGERTAPDEAPVAAPDDAPTADGTEAAPGAEAKGKGGRKGQDRRGKGKAKPTPANLAVTAERVGVVGKDGKVPEPEGPVIMALDLVGNRLISKDVVLLSLDLKPGDRIKQSKLDADVKAIKELGYFAYVAPEVVPTTDEGVTVLFKVVENPILREVKVEGATLLPVEELQKNIVVEPGNVLNSTQLLESLSRINAVYQKKGYAFCGVLSSDQFEMDPSTGILTLRVAEPVLGRVKFVGNKKTRSFVLMREMEAKRGRVLKAEPLRRSLRNLGRLNYFEEIRPPKPTLSEDLSVVDLEIEVKEQRTGTASAGGGYSSLNGAIGFFDVAETNFRGRGQTVRLKWEFGGQKSYQLDFVEPWLNGRPQSLGLSIFQTRTDRARFRQSLVTNLYEEKRVGFAVNTGWRIAKDQRLSLGFSNESVEANSNNLAPLPLDLQRLDLDGDGRVAFDQQFITLGWVWDARDSPFNANEGYRIGVSVSTTGGFLDGPAGFQRYLFDLRKYFPLGKKDKEGKTGWTIATRLKYGFHSVFEGFLNFNDRFALGGSDSLRGYEDREFTGERFALGNFEVRKHLSKLVTLVGFYDLGDAWGLDGEELDLRSGLGFGVRFTTPIGPFRLDYGLPDDDRGGRFHFGIGQQF